MNYKNMLEFAVHMNSRCAFIAVTEHGLSRKYITIANLLDKIYFPSRPLDNLRVCC